MKRSTRRAPSADSLTWTMADRAAIRQSRVNTQSGRFQRESAIEKAHSRAAPTKDSK